MDEEIVDKTSVRQRAYARLDEKPDAIILITIHDQFKISKLLVSTLDNEPATMVLLIEAQRKLNKVLSDIATTHLHRHVRND